LLLFLEISVMIRGIYLPKIFFKTISLMYILVLMFGCGQNAKVNTQPEPVKQDSMFIREITNSKLRNVTFLPYWVSNAQFAGYYVAREKGIYEKYGINLNIISYKPFITSTDLIADGKADFAALWLVNAIELRAKGVDIVNIIQPSFRSSAMLITKKKSQINNIRDMDEKRAGIWIGYELQPQTLFNKYNLHVEIVPIGSSNNLFLMDGVDIINANWFDEYHSIINSGYDPEELNVFFYSDYGLNFLEDGIYCLSDKLKNDPELCVDFINATLEGWKYAFSHKEEAVQIVLEYAKRDKLPVNSIHQQWMLDRYNDLYLPEGKTEFNNKLSEADYLFIAGLLKENNLITVIPPFNEFYQPAIK
jgi:NitT/TauT family transport system substrate-binding protein